MLAICRIVAFRYESHVTGHQIKDEIITYRTSLHGLFQVEAKKFITISA